MWYTNIVTKTKIDTSVIDIYSVYLLSNNGYK